MKHAYSTKNGIRVQYGAPARYRIRVQRSIVLVAAAVVVSLGAVAAYAYFTAAGAGGGSASTASMQTVTVAATAGTPGTPLRPGGSGDVTLQATNPNSFAVVLVSVAAGTGSITADAGHPGCTTTGVTFTPQAGLSVAIAGGATTQVNLPGAAAMSAASSSGCQGATFSVPVTITVQK